MIYKELNLTKIRTAAGLDFAHYTYQKGMCSCCYNPKDLPKRYWKDGIIPEDKQAYSGDSEEVTDDEYTYLLFKNADNNGGVVKGNDEIKKYQCIEWGFPMEKLDTVCSMLQEQVGDEYEVEKPENHLKCIVIKKKGE